MLSTDFSLHCATPLAHFLLSPERTLANYNSHKCCFSTICALTDVILCIRTIVHFSLSYVLLLHHAGNHNSCAVKVCRMQMWIWSRKVSIFHISRVIANVALRVQWVCTYTIFILCSFVSGRCNKDIGSFRFWWFNPYVIIYICIIPTQYAQWATRNAIKIV